MYRSKFLAATGALGVSAVSAGCVGDGLPRFETGTVAPAGEGTPEGKGSDRAPEWTVPVPESRFFEAVGRRHVGRFDRFYVLIRDDHYIEVTGKRGRAESITAVADPLNAHYAGNDGPETVEVVPGVDGYWLVAPDDGTWTISARADVVRQSSYVLVDRITVETDGPRVVDASVEEFPEA